MRIPIETPKQQRVFDYITQEPHSAIEISKACYCDARSVIRTLRNNGIAVNDEWRDSADHTTRYKWYYINPNYPMKPKVLCNG
ncbi:MAG: hypothetical protein LIP09_08035 [Bacteroidales bacterium]|nr:hypothetical protein [Bacteroidales bacterium]